MKETDSRQSARQLSATLRTILNGTGATAVVSRKNGKDRIEILRATHPNALRFSPYGNVRWEDVKNRLDEWDSNWNSPYGIQIHIEKGEQDGGR